MIFYIFAHSVISQEIPGQGTYQIRMIPYHDAQFTSPYEGEVEIQVNQQMYVAVEVEGVDVNQIATVLDNCWATPVNDIDHDIRWSLIIREWVGLMFSWLIDKIFLSEYNKTVVPYAW